MSSVFKAEISIHYPKNFFDSSDLSVKKDVVIPPFLFHLNWTVSALWKLLLTTMALSLKYWYSWTKEGPPEQKYNYKHKTYNADNKKWSNHWPGST